MNICLPRSRRARWLASTGAVVVIALVLATVWRAFLSPPDRGPLRVDGDPSVGHSGTVNVGDRIVWGFNIARNTGSAPARLVSVQMVPQSSSTAVVAAWAYPVSSNVGTIGLDVNYDDNDNDNDLADLRNARKPLAGYTIPAGEDTWIWAIIEIREPGRWDWTALRLTYLVGGKTHVVEGGNALTICAPKGVACKMRPPGDLGK